MLADSSDAASSKLQALAWASFPDLKRAELKLAREAPRGKFAYCGPSGDVHDTTNDPAHALDEPIGWGPGREIRAGFIRWLCVDRQARELIDPKGIQVLGAKITGHLDLDYITAPFPLMLQDCRLLEDADLHGLEVPLLDLQGTWTRSIAADVARVKDNVFLRNGFHAEGEVHLIDTQIGGDLDCEDGKFTNPPQNGLKASGTALNADGVDVKGSVFLRHGFHAEGEVRLLGAQIGGSLECDHGTFINPPQNGLEASGTALNADRINVKGGIFLRDGFHAEGEVRLLGAEIGGTLDCDGGKFANPPQSGLVASGKALSAERIDVKGDVVLRNGFHAEGEVGLLGAHIGGDLVGYNATFHGMLDGQRAAIKGALFWVKINDADKVTLDLANASVAALADDQGSWPGYGNLVLDGFVYGRISHDPQNAASRIQWLERQTPFSPQPYRQLAKVLTDDGDDDDAKLVLIEMERRLRATGWLAESWSGVLRWTIGYGYRPLRALAGLGFLTGLGWIIYRRASLVHAMVPADKDDRQHYLQDLAPPSQCTRFSPFIYSLENSLPLVKLGQADNWQPDALHPAAPVPTPNWRARLAGWRFGLIRWATTGNRWTRFCRWIESPGFLWGFLWIQILLGWVLATLFAAGVTGIVHSK